MKCSASEIWYRLYVEIVDVKFSLVHYDTSTLKHYGLGAGARSMPTLH